MRAVARLVHQITGKTLHVVDVAGWYRQSDTTIEVPPGVDWPEAALHEVCHWLVATPEQRASPDNLGLGHSGDGYDGRSVWRREARAQERWACRLQAVACALADVRIPTRCTSDHRPLGAAETRMLLELVDVRLVSLATACAAARAQIAAG